jgi:NADPH2:quinone reductase
MRAVLCKEFGPPEKLVFEENLPSPKPSEGEAVIAVHAASVNFPDILMIQNKYQFQPPMPFSPGSELSGIVKEVGAGVNNIKPGDHVLVGAGWGGFADEYLANKDRLARLIKLPPQVDFAAAAAFYMTYGTSYHALKQRAQLQPGETVVVLGAAGGVGLAAVELAKLMGARVVAAASSSEKLDLCRSYGADDVINYVTEDLKERIKELTGGKGADVIYDPVGDKFSEPALRATAWKGRFLVVGFAAGEIPKIPLNLVLLKGCQIVGVFWGSFTRQEPKANEENSRELLGWLANGKIKPYIQKRYPLRAVPEALQDMAARKVMGKIIIDTRS